MKASKEFVEEIRADYKQFVDNLSEKDRRDAIEWAEGNLNRKRYLYWELYNYLNRGNDYSDYTKDLKDSHIYTAIKRAISIPYMITGKTY